jgi:hypothetical protein
MIDEEEANYLKLKAEYKDSPRRGHAQIHTIAGPA